MIQGGGQLKKRTGGSSGGGTQGTKGSERAFLG